LLRLAGYGQPDVAKPADSSDLAVTLDRGTER
jgi:hypothetical protein